jgi:hypothetical protein
MKVKKVKKNTEIKKKDLISVITRYFAKCMSNVYYLL